MPTHNSYAGFHIRINYLRKYENVRVQWIRKLYLLYYDNSPGLLVRINLDCHPYALPHSLKGNLFCSRI